mmetsp:Transcript_31593/g.96696  ORF Transcript_31593/g.96696 Transcript_31593/m.96696 type:complete len:101 (+) Transcript_31593:148-450(+)
MLWRSREKTCVTGDNRGCHESRIDEWIHGMRALPSKAARKCLKDLSAATTFRTIFGSAPGPLSLLDTNLALGVSFVVSRYAECRLIGGAHVLLQLQQWRR